MIKSNSKKAWATGLGSEWRILTVVGKLEGLQVGDVVIRHVGDGGGRLRPWMRMLVKSIDAETVHCAALESDGSQKDFGWTFDLATGAEIDDDLRWGPRYGITGSCIRKAEEER